MKDKAFDGTKSPDKKKNYVVIGKGAENPDILQWSNSFLAQGKWNPDRNPFNASDAPYSSISGHPVTFLFTGITDKKIIAKQLKDENREVFHLLEETLRRLVLFYAVPAIDLRVEDIICLGDSRNCLAVQLTAPVHQLKAFHKDLINEFNQFELFDPIIDRYSFSVHTTIAYKRMNPETFRTFEAELQKLLNATQSLAEKALLIDILDYVKNSPLSQITRNIKTDLLKLGFPADKLQQFQQSLAISDDELAWIKRSFHAQAFKKRALNIQSVMYVERPEIMAKSGYSETVLFNVPLYYLYPSIPDPFLKKIFKQFPIRLENECHSMMFLTGARTRGTALPNSDWDILVFLRGAIDIKRMRQTLHKVALELFAKDTDCKSIDVVDKRHSIGLYLFDGKKITSIDLVPINTREASMTSPFRVYDSQLNLWKPCNPRKARIDLDTHPFPRAIRYLIQFVKMWNKSTGSRLRSFHIERLLVDMPCSSIPNLMTALGLAFDFIGQHVQVPLIYDDKATSINRSIISDSAPQSATKHCLRLSELKKLKSELLDISMMFRMATVGIIYSLYDRGRQFQFSKNELYEDATDHKNITNTYKVDGDKINKSAFFSTNMLNKAQVRIQKILDHSESKLSPT